MAADTIVCGTNGSVSIDGRGARIGTWQARLLQNTIDVTGYGTGGFSENIGGLKTLQGSAGGVMTSGSTSDQPGWTSAGTCATGSLIVLTADSGCSYTFTGILSELAITHDVANVGRIVFNFISNGVVNEQWAVS